MSNSVAIPELLNDVARAGATGFRLPADPLSLAALELCRSSGYPIRYDSGHAFLPYDHDALVPAWIEGESPPVAWNSTAVRGFLEIGSTNEEALIQAQRGAAAGTVIFAVKQLSGRGRKGRSWISPAGGIYCSLVVRPSQPRNRWPLLTHVASVAAVEALKDLLSEYGGVGCPSPDLKWPNDVYLCRRKAAGILLETVSARGLPCAAVIGLGINVRQDGVPEELEREATSISREAGAAIPRRRLLVRFLHHFQLWYGHFERGEQSRLLDHWKENSSMWTGTPVWIDDGDRRTAAVTCGLTDLGALRIRRSDGIEETLLAGDVTIRRA